MLYQQPQSGRAQADDSSALGKIDFLWNAGAGNADSVSGKLANKRGSNLVGPSGIFADLSSAGYQAATFSGVPAIGNQYTLVMVLAFPTANVSTNYLVRQTNNIGNFRVEVQSGASGVGVQITHQGVALGTTLVASPLPGGFGTMKPWVYICTYDGTTARQYLSDGVNRYTVNDVIGYNAVADNTLEFNNANAPAFPLQLFAVAKRSIGATAVKSIQDNPWQLFLDEEEEESLLYVQAAGGTNGTFPGTTMAATASVIAGAMAGQRNETLAGATLTTTASVIGGTMSASAGATFAGQVLTATASLINGAMSGQQFGTLAGQVLTAIASIVPGVMFVPGSGAASGRNRFLHLKLALGF